MYWICFEGVTHFYVQIPPYCDITVEDNFSVMDFIAEAILRINGHILICGLNLLQIHKLNTKHNKYYPRVD